MTTKFSEKWAADKLLKQAKKKSKKALVTQGHTPKEATKLVKQAVNRIAAKPPRKAAGRGR